MKEQQAPTNTKPQKSQGYNVVVLGLSRLPIASTHLLLVVLFQGEGHLALLQPLLLLVGFPLLAVGLSSRRLPSRFFCCLLCAFVKDVGRRWVATSSKGAFYDEPRQYKGSGEVSFSRKTMSRREEFCTTVRATYSSCVPSIPTHDTEPNKSRQMPREKRPSDHPSPGSPPSLVFAWPPPPLRNLPLP